MNEQSVPATGHTSTTSANAGAPEVEQMPITPENVFWDAESLHRISPAMVVMTDADAKVRFANPSFCAATGYSEKELLGKDYFSVFVPEAERERLRQAYAALFLETYDTSGTATRKRSSAVTPLLRKDGSQVEILWYAALHVDDAGKPVALCGFGSESPDYEMRLSRITDEQRLGDYILRDIGEGVVVLDPDDRILRISRVAEQLIGWSAEELQGKKWHEMVPFERSDGTRFSDGAVRRAMRDRKPVTAEYYYVRRDGTRFPVRVTAGPVFNREQGELIGVTVVFSDITREKELMDAQAEFVAVAAHQLRTPIASAMLQLEVLLQGAEGMDPDVRESLEDLEETHERLQELVNRLLATSRLELGATAVQPEPTVLQELITEVVQEMEPLAKETETAIVPEVPKEQTELPVDTDLLKTTLENLVANALRYSDKSGSEVCVRMQSVRKDEPVAGTPAPDAGLTISVVDHGMGIAKEEQDMIFQKLYRTKAAKKRQKEGSGLGLSTAKRAMELSGCRLWFASEEGKGSTFVIWLPQGGMRPRPGASSLVHKRNRRSHDR